MKLLKIALLCLVFIKVAVTDKVPIYESPVIVRAGSFKNDYNPRIDSLNDSSSKNYQRYLNRKLRDTAHNDLIRDFSLSNFDKLVSIYELGNLNEKPVAEKVEDIGNILAKSIDLQNFINFKSNLILKKLALLDVKLKQIKLLDDATESIKVHPGDINSNNPNNIVWKEKINRIIETISASNSKYNVAYSSICSILGVAKEDLTEPIPDSKAIQPPSIDTQIYPKINISQNQNKPVNKIIIQENVPVRDEQTLKEGLEALAKLNEKSNEKAAEKQKEKEKTKKRRNNRVAENNAYEDALPQRKGRKNRHSNIGFHNNY